MVGILFAECIINFKWALKLSYGSTGCQVFALHLEICFPNKCNNGILIFARWWYSFHLDTKTKMRAPHDNLRGEFNSIQFFIHTVQDIYISVHSRKIK